MLELAANGGTSRTLDSTLTKVASIGSTAQNGFIHRTDTVCPSDDRELAGSQKEQRHDVADNSSDTIVPTCPVAPDGDSSAALTAVAPRPASPEWNIPCISRHNKCELLQGLANNVLKIREGLSIQRSCVSEIIFCYSEEALEGLLVSVIENDGASITPGTLCEICAVAATSGQYVRHLLDTKLLDVWYGKCRPGELY